MATCPCARYAGRSAIGCPAGGQGRSPGRQQSGVLPEEMRLLVSENPNARTSRPSQVSHASGEGENGAFAPAAVVILAAGEGTRMKSRTPKVLHTLSGRSLLGHAIAVAGDLGPQRLVIVVGHAREQVSAAARAVAPEAAIVVQEQQLGTGHAVRMVIESLGVLAGTVVVTYGDMPLLRGRTLAELASRHAQAGNAVTVLTARGDFPGFGRIVRDADGAFLRIVEERDATEAELGIDEFNSGCYAFDGTLLADAIKRVTTSNSQREEYLTDVVEILRGDGHPVGALLAADPAEIRGVNDRVQLAQARRALNDRILTDWMLDGVTIVDPASTWNPRHAHHRQGRR